LAAHEGARDPAAAVPRRALQRQTVRTLMADCLRLS